MYRLLQVIFERGQESVHIAVTVSWPAT